jgi:CRISPR-associated protein (TIGR02710 family)
MNEVLIVTLGTSPGVIVNCINSLRPDRTIFICSTETRPLIDEIRSKVPMPNFDEQRDVVELQQRLATNKGEDVSNELDQLDRVYLRARNLFQILRQQNPGCRLIADYTGGTKTMTTGLAMAAIDDGDVKLHLTAGDRSAGQTGMNSYSSPVAVSTPVIYARRLRDGELPVLLKRHDYEAARQAVRRAKSYGTPDRDTDRTLNRLETLLKALDAWDRFDHRTALEGLQLINERCFDSNLMFPLKRVIASRRLLDKKHADPENWPQMKGHGLEAVEDLLRNAERRATQDRFDDAVGRLYRAMELTAQLLLKIAVTDQVGSAGIDTGNVDLDLLPADIRPRWSELTERKTNEAKDSKLKIGLADSYDLLSDLGHPTGLYWLDQRKALVHSLNIRNESLFAHGFAPVGYEGWAELKSKLGAFLQTAIEKHAGVTGTGLILSQLPTTLDELEIRD